jgi:hypothetical protein
MNFFEVAKVLIYDKLKLDKPEKTKLIPIAIGTKFKTQKSNNLDILFVFVFLQLQFLP